MLLNRYISEVIFDCCLDQNSYLQTLPVVKDLYLKHKIVFSSNVTFFVGENGTGKSTLLEAIAVAFGFNPEGGTKNCNFSTQDTHYALWEHINIIKRGYPKDGFFFRAESLYNFATYIDDIDANHNYDGSLHKKSHGESFLSIFQNRFSSKGKGIYILDEPEAALSPMKTLSLMTIMNDLIQRDSQFIIATHSPILMAFPSADILEFSEDGIRKTNYKSTEHYKVSKIFFDNPERMLFNLLEK